MDDTGAQGVPSNYQPWGYRSVRSRQPYDNLHQIRFSHKTVSSQMPAEKVSAVYLGEQQGSRVAGQASECLCSGGVISVHGGIARAVALQCVQPARALDAPTEPAPVEVAVHMEEHGHHLNDPHSNEWKCD